MKQQADQHRTERTFQVGEWVYLKLQPFRQLSVRRCKNNELSPKFFGPFQIIQKVGEVAYKLKLPDSSQIHPVFHVSQLKAKIGTQETYSSDLPSTDEHSNILPVPVRVLATPQRRRGNHSFIELLVQWQGQTTAEATWEKLYWLRAQYPDLDHEVKVVSEQRVFVMELQ